MNNYWVIKIVTVLACFPLTNFCSPNFNMIGYATMNGGTTGGKGGTMKTVSTLLELENWAKNREKNTTPEILTIRGKISASTTTLITIKNGANITIQGEGTSSELQNVGLNIRDYTNIIVSNLMIHEVSYPDDALTLDNVQQGWVDHCELYSKIGEGIDVDTYDGLLDIKKGSSGITISWCYLHDHMKCSLVGHTDNTNQQETDGKIRVTYHHNSFINTDGRNPSLRFGAVHMFNNYFGNLYDYGIAVRDGGHARIENCYYENVVLPMSTDKFPVDGLPNGYICQTGNFFTGTCGENVISQTGCDFWNSSTLPYSYALDETATVKATVQRYAGVKEYRVVVDNTSNATFIRGRGVQKNDFFVHMNGIGLQVPNGDIYDFNGKKQIRRLSSHRSDVVGIVIVRKVFNR